jgi:regulator of RNase E activity RraB
VSLDILVLAELEKVSNLSESHTVRHYLYFSRREEADKVAEVLARAGYRTEARLSQEVDNESWLVLACHEIVLTLQLIASTRDFLEKLAADAGGDYDGWEAEVLSGR